MEVKNRIILTAMVGSHNYNLDTEESDTDYKSIIIPTMDGIFSNKLMNKSTVSKDRDDAHIDIRTFRKELLSSSPNSIEMLFSHSFDYEEGNKSVELLFDLKEEIAGMNKSMLYKAYMGMAKGDTLRLDKPVNQGSSAYPYYEKHGYNTKVLVNIVRGYSTLIRYARSGFEDYQSAIFVKEDVRHAMLFAKNGGFTLDEAHTVINGLKIEAETLKEQYESFEFNKELADKVTRILHHEMLKSLISEVE